MNSTSVLEEFFIFNEFDFCNILNTQRDFKHNDLYKCILNNNT